MVLALRYEVTWTKPESCHRGKRGGSLRGSDGGGSTRVVSCTSLRSLRIHGYTRPPAATVTLHRSIDRAYHQSNVSLRHAWVAHRHRSERPIQRTPPSRSLAGPRPRPRHDHLYSSSSSPHTVRLTVAASKGGEATIPSHTPPRRVRHPAPRFDLISATGSSRSLALPPVVPRLHHASSCRPPPSFVPAPPPPLSVIRRDI